MTEFWIVLLVVVVLSQSAAIATSVSLHRALAHRSLAVHPVAEGFLRIRREWVAVHRKPHAFTDIRR